MPFSDFMQLPPEIALQNKRLDRRQRIADLLLQKGLQPVQNEQHGRFYVAPSPWQHLAKGAEVLAGGYLSKKNDDASKEMVDQYQKLMADEVKGKLDQLNSGAPSQPAVPGVPAQAGNLQDLISATPGRTLDASALDVLPTNQRTPLDTRSPSDAQLKDFISRYSEDMGDSFPHDTFKRIQAQRLNNPNFDTTAPRDVGPDLTAQALTMPTPAQAARPAQPATGGQDPATKQRLIQELMLSRYNPQARALGQMLSQQQFQEKEHGLTRELTREQKDADRQNAMIIASSKIDQMIGMKLITQEAGDTLKRELATQANETKRELATQANETKRDVAKQHDTTLRAIASMKAGTTDKPKLKPGERMKADGTVEAIPGSDVYVKQSGLHSKDYGALMTMNTKTEQSIKKIDEILDPKNTSAFNSNFGGYNAYLTERIPGATQDVRQKIESIKSDLKSAGLEIMRSGGSVGQMTQAEWPIVEKMIDAIDPRMSEKAARDAFQNIKTYLGTIRSNATKTYETEWGDTQFFKGAKSPLQSSPSESQKVIDFKDLPK